MAGKKVSPAKKAPPKVVKEAMLMVKNYKNAIRGCGCVHAAIRAAKAGQTYSGKKHSKADKK
jgi:hypothetical protein